MNTLPSYESGLVPQGHYEAEVIGEVQERESSFDKTKTYLELPFCLKSERLGDYARFLWAFTPRSPKFAEFLVAIGGKRLFNGNVEPPRGPYVGKKVVLNIGQRTAKNDKSKIVNEVLGVFPFTEEQPQPSPKEEDDSDLPEGLRGRMA
jgi:hypothetical protein